DEGRVVADDEDRLVAELLELAQFPQRNGVAEMHVHAGRVNAELDAQRLIRGDAALELFRELVEAFDLLDAAANDAELFLKRSHLVPRVMAELPRARPTTIAAMCVHQTAST